MAVYTAITHKELEAYLSLYPLPPLADFSGIAAGVSNSNFLLSFTDGQKLILTLFEARTPWDDLPYFLALMEHLAALGINCPQPVRGRDGDALHTIAAHPAAMVSFLNGSSVMQPEARHATAMGAQMGRMHRAVADFPLRRRNSMGPAVWYDLLNKSDDGTATLADIRHHAMQVMAQWPQNLPQGAIHADLFPDNVFFSGDQLSGVIDFYFACHDCFAYDLAIAVNAWCCDANGAVQSNMARALLHGYQSERPLTADEQHAMPLLLQGAALRFLSSRQYDWQHRPTDALLTPKDPKAFRDILAFHMDNPLLFPEWLL